ncbi:MAG: acetyltransferase [Anaerolineae bacterium]|mgnify:CR=1 FL=1|jgi:sugar O-acyltransferase (sialic acid O-acetyltransferase NeuD family)|nr:acetyltransferase [Anaerolineae bacterium]MBT7075311.1 acetyltransferase [Anaerolineae bacterium]MBT7783746.1 acetyltransferase [Anaerolineae bacterium]
MEDIFIIGSGGHAKVIIGIVEKEGKYNILGLLNAQPNIGEKILGYEVLGKDTDLGKFVKIHAIKGVIIAVGDNFTRSKVVERIKKENSELSFFSAIHPASAISSDVIIGQGTVIMAGVSVNVTSSIGEFCILNTNSSLDHDSEMDDFASLAPGVTVGGECEIGEYSAINIGAILLPRIKIGEHSVIGAGSLINKPVASFEVVYGSPAKKIRERKEGEKYL